MHKLVEQILLLFKTQKVENFLAQIFVLFQFFIFAWEQTLRFRFENLKSISYKLKSGKFFFIIIKSCDRRFYC
jgi:hypothetical protein